VAVGDGHRVALFFTGHRHAGENLERVLAHRAAELGPLIQMSDAASMNHVGDFETTVACCLAHARRRFVEAAAAFPQECYHALNLIGKVYANDAEARKQGLSPDDRLRYHQQRSAPIMKKLSAWMQEQLEEHHTVPNSRLGKAMGYMLEHWEPLTLFLREPGAPLDNNVAERALKRAILHRKNSLFFKTQPGADVADLFMSLIHTAELCGVDAFHYLTALQKNARRVAANPGEWLPWNYPARRPIPSDDAK